MLSGGAAAVPSSLSHAPVCDYMKRNYVVGLGCVVVVVVVVCFSFLLVLVASVVSRASARVLSCSCSCSSARASYVGRSKSHKFSFFGFLLFVPSAAAKQLGRASFFS